jgi:hypothetical protein
MMAMPRRSETRERVRLGLFEQGPPHVELPPTNNQQLAALVETLMIEIAAALATEEVGDDQDHR